MPRYDYKCADCQSEFELRQSFAEAGSGMCPSSSGIGRRVFHAVPVIYKGSGFYTTDYGRPKQPSDNGAKDSSDSKSSSDDGASKSKESTPASEGASAGSSKSSSESTSDSTAKSSSEAEASS